MVQSPPLTQPGTPATVTFPGSPGVAPIALPGAPRTVQDIRALRAQRNELSYQLSSAGSRRASLARQLITTSDPVAKAGLESRIAVLDKRMNQLENDIATTGQQLSSAPAALIATTQGANTMFGLEPNYLVPLLGFFIVFVLCPLSIGIARVMWKRSSRPVLPAAIPEANARLGRLEQSVDAIAVEVERITEGQRFITKLLSEAKAPALPAGADRQTEAVRSQQ
jgi:hypothetical protein